MKYLRKFESVKHLNNVIKDSEKLTDKIKSHEDFIENAYVINGAWFPFGLKEREGKIMMPDKYLSKMMNEIIKSANKKFNHDLILPICFNWLSHIMIKEPFSIIPIPLYVFQAPLYEKEKAIEISEYLTKKFENLSVIAIAGGWTLPNKNNPHCSYGDSYIKSGKFIDDINLLQKYWNKDDKIFFIE